jgi:hypothetical protein
MGQSSFGAIFVLHNQLSLKYWSDLLSMVKFAYNNTLIHSSTQQTPLFANHGLHPKFDIQRMHKNITRKMLMTITKTNQTSRLKTKSGFDNKTSR